MASQQAAKRVTAQHGGAPARRQKATTDPTPDQIKRAGFRNRDEYNASLTSAHRVLGQNQNTNTHDDSTFAVNGDESRTAGDVSQLNHRQQAALRLQAQARLTQQQDEARQARLRTQLQGNARAQSNVGVHQEDFSTYATGGLRQWSQNGWFNLATAGVPATMIASGDHYAKGENLKAATTLALLPAAVAASRFPAGRAVLTAVGGGTAAYQSSQGDYSNAAATATGTFLFPWLAGRSTRVTMAGNRQATVTTWRAGEGPSTPSARSVEPRAVPAVPSTRSTVAANKSGKAVPAEEPATAPQKPAASTATAAAPGAPGIAAQKQAGHVRGTPQYNNRVKAGKPTSAFDDDASATQYTQEAWQKGTEVPGRPGVRDYDFGMRIGSGPGGGGQTRVRVHMDAQGRIHGHPVGPEKIGGSR